MYFRTYFAIINNSHDKQRKGFCTSQDCTPDDAQNYRNIYRRILILFHCILHNTVH